MKPFYYAIALNLAMPGWAQTIEPVKLGGTGTRGAPGRIGFDFKLMGDGPEKVLPMGWGTLVSGFRPRSGDAVTFLSRFVYDSSAHVYFGYELLVEKQLSGDYLVTTGKLNMSALELVAEIRNNPPRDWPISPPSTNSADWTFQPLPSYPAPRFAHERETIRIDLVTDQYTGRKMYDKFQILPESGPARARIVP
jgi:hypothetical protein